VHEIHNTDRDLTISVLGVHLDDASHLVLKGILASLPGFELTGSLKQYFGEKDASLVRTLRESHPEICLVDLDRDRQMALETVEYLHRSASLPISIFALSSRMDSDSIIAAMRSGCTEYLSKPIQSERVQEALLQISRKKRDSLAPPVQGKIVTLMGVKGGVGTTTLAVHLSYTLASQRKKVLLIDLHPELGEITLHLGLEHHNYGFSELVCNLKRMDAELLQGFVLKHESGLEVLASPEALGSTSTITLDGIQSTIRSLVRMYDYVIIDTNFGFDERNLSLVELADELCLITTANLPAVRSASRFLDYLHRLNYPASKVHVIVNRLAKNSPISLEQIEKVLLRKVSQTVPNSEIELAEAIGTGVPVPVKSRSDFMQSIGKWGRRLTGEGDGKSSGGSKPNSKVPEPRSRFNVLGIYG
jgi:pilus assembly protein CpaE